MKSVNGIKKTGKPGIDLLKKLYNSSLKITVLALIFLLSFSVLLLIQGCKKQAASETTAAAASVSAATAAESLSVATTSVSSTAVQETKETAAETAAETATESAAESTEAIPADITDLIKKADGYYAAGQYGLSKSTYRKAIIAIDDSGLSEEAKQEIKDSFQEKYNKSKTIVETALVHFGNAMQLEYETRYEEAKSELEAALAIYPKYEDAIEAYNNLKAIMGLE